MMLLLEKTRGGYADMMGCIKFCIFFFYKFDSFSCW